MKLVSFVQPNFRQGPKEFNAHYLPYSAGVLWSYVNQSEFVRDNYSLHNFVWKRDSIENSLDLIKDSDIVGFSTYIWNRNYNYTLAKTLKKYKPDCTIIFGGPEPPITHSNFFEEFPFIDIMVKLEGERTFRAILENLQYEALFSTPGMLLNNNGRTLDTGEPTRINNLEEIPSPYLTGIFDDLLIKHQDVEWNATLETNRGCPYQCTFCDWGSLTYNKIKKFELTRVFHEIEWSGKNKCGFLSITDANFGVFPERDELIADKIIETQNQYGYPVAYSATWAKNQKHTIINIVKKLINSPKGFNQGLTVSVQSLDEKVLENIKRKNLELNKIEEIFSICDQNNIPVYTEVILGLPGESLETWKQNFWKLFEAGNHTGINIYQAQMLENAEMNLTQKEEYNITDQVVYDYMSGSYNEDELKEGVKVITSTKDLPFNKMLEAQIFSWFVNTFHINGISTFISRFLHKYSKVGYDEFYNKFFSYIEKDEWFKEEINDLIKYYTSWMTTGKIGHPIIGNIEIHGWNLIHRTVIKVHVDNKYDTIFNLLKTFVKETFPLPDSLFEQLFTFQEHYLINYNNINKYPKTLKFDYDFLGYLQNDLPLESLTEYEFDFNEDKTMSFPRFLDNIYFGRKRNFGKAWITKTSGKKPLTLVNIA